MYKGRVIVAIDGPAGAGKSTSARKLARKLGFLYLDTGALYRAVAWKVLTARQDPKDNASVEKVCFKMDLKLFLSDEGVRVLVDRENVTEKIRTPEVSQAASVVAEKPAVRRFLLEVQREIGRGLGSAPGVVAEGRDIGTVVFPEASVKFFLEASPDVRVQRRHLDLKSRGLTKGIEVTQEELDQRDRRDTDRELAPLKPADDAIRIDSTALDVNGVVEEMVRVLREKKVIPGAANSE